ncbi:PKS-NRPS hybrid synthetase cheA-like [Mercurialis annua]|uniref:PKS-NRPS hybrid synthetase cheA-like n=1 Tax=Mercurialis annua TaxID=3986 RepID=UPI00215F0680|nr:PKS-NRPS hybrid synthetase cheA-like [Mercurialis annua]
MTDKTSKSSEYEYQVPETNFPASPEVQFEVFSDDSVDYSGQFNPGIKFKSDVEAIQWAKRVAIHIGFELVISSHKNGGTRKLLKCSRGERYRGLINSKLFKRKNTKTKACKCPFAIMVQLKGVEWKVVAKSGSTSMHNHDLIVYPEGHRQMSGLSPASKQIVRDMSTAQAKPCAIWASLQEKNPSNNPTRRQIYNYRDNLRRSGFEGRDVVGQFYHMAVEGRYVHWTLADSETSALTHIFLAHPNSVRLLRDYRWIIGMDSTYKTNKYKMPFFEIIGMTPCNKNFIIAYAIIKDETHESYRWVLERLRLLIDDDVHPTAIVTDRESGLVRPVGEVFPRTSHLLCTWHINKDVEDKVFRLCGLDRGYAEAFKNGRWKNIIEAPTETEYKAAVILMRNQTRAFPAVAQYVEKTWLAHKEKFCCAWTNNVMHFGNTTTCRVESAHAQLKQWLNSSTGSLDTVWTKVDMVIQSQLSEIRFTLEQSRRNVGSRRQGFPFNYLSCKVSHYCLDLIDKELERMIDLSTDVHDQCGCVLRSTHQIPCACELRGVIDSGIPISVDSIHPFWMQLVISDGVDTSKQARCVVESEDLQYFRGIVGEVMTQDRSVIRDISLMIYDRLHPEESSYGEPEVKTDVKGPKQSICYGTSTCL